MPALPETLQPRFDLTLAGLLLEQERQTPDRVLLVQEGREITVAELACAARAEAAALRARGIAPGDPVLTMLEAGPTHIALVLGVALTGALWVPISPDARGPFLEHALSVAKPVLALVARSAAGALREAGYPADRPLEERDGWEWRAPLRRAPALRKSRRKTRTRTALFSSPRAPPDRPRA